jgi:hypothetical protein
LPIADLQFAPPMHQSTVDIWQSGNELAGMTRLELANQLIENQSAFHFAFIPVFQLQSARYRGVVVTLVRVERFELIIKLILSQPPLPIGLHAQGEFRIADCGFVSASGPNNALAEPL